MDNNIKEKLELMIKKFEEELELNSAIVDTIQKLDSSTNELKTKMEETSDSIENIFKAFELAKFNLNVEESIENLRKAGYVIKKIKESMDEIGNIRDEFETYNQELKDEYDKIIANNKKKEKIIEDISNTLLNTEEIKKSILDGEKTLEETSKTVKECKVEIVKSNYTAGEVKKNIKTYTKYFEDEKQKLKIIENKVDNLSNEVDNLSNKKDVLNRINTLEKTLTDKIEEFISKSQIFAENDNSETTTPVLNDNKKSKKNINNNKKQLKNNAVKQVVSNKKTENDIDENMQLAIESKVNDIVNQKIESLLTKFISIMD